MARPPNIPSQLRSRPFLGHEAIDRGLLTKAQLRGNSWTRLFRDVYISSSVSATHIVRIQAATLILPAPAVVTGRSAAIVWGASTSEFDGPVEVLALARFGPVQGLAIRTGPIGEDATVRWSIPITTPERTAWEIARTLAQVDAVSWIDALARSRGLSRADLMKHAQRYGHGRGNCRAAETLARCDPRAESPAESRLRLLVADSALPAPIPQHHVMAGGMFVARVDFAWPQLRLAIEYDGRWHGGALDEDRQRWRAITAAGWQIFPVTAQDMRNPERLIRELTGAYRQRAIDLAGKTR